MKIKIAVSLFIFIFLFSAALILQIKTQREYFDNQLESHKNQLNLVPLNTQNTPASINPKKFYEPFKPREYIRITTVHGDGSRGQKP
ncbi:hypothetical protein [Neobacillus muris]|uniref:hypothetical protein n=1 Tax=Neobacillus muris TaxID=2941334 RepID=UPI00203E7E76|nr:hypothetical protein [Neobacillus muris]